MGQSLPSLTHLWVWNSNPIITWNHPVLKNWITIDQTIKTSTEINSVLLWEENPNSNTESFVITKDDLILSRWKQFWWEYNDETKKYSLNWIEFDWIDEIFEEDDFLIMIAYSNKMISHKYNKYADNAKTISTWSTIVNKNDKTRVIIDLKEWRILNTYADTENLVKKNPTLYKKISYFLNHN